jgi:Outer membrane protein beta-barrel domain
MSGMHGMRILAVLIGCCCTPGLAAAQTSSPNPWGYGTTLSGSVGVGVDSDHTGSALGAAIGWELTPKVAIEGSGAWLDRGPGADAFSAALKLRASMFGRDRVAPFVTAGVGMYRATYARDAHEVPSFHRRRMGTGLTGRQTFSDPALVFGGGVNMFLNRHVAVRPDVEAMVVMRDSQRYVVTTAALHVAFHFEDHPVTPSRRGR